MQQDFEIEEYIQCPQCGYSLPLYFKYTKLVQCKSCKSNIFLEDDAVRLWGDSSVLAPEISILKLNTPFFYQNKTYLPLGKVRYSYGRGFWEEWWIKDTQDNTYWLSVDEGDLVLEKSIDVDYSSSFFETLKLGDRVSDEWVVTELAKAKCEGFEGALPKSILIGESYKYAHLSGKGAKLRTLELSNGKVEVYEGHWISPFDIKVQ
jgi:hypothetical protein